MATRSSTPSTGCRSVPSASGAWAITSKAPRPARCRTSAACSRTNVASSGSGATTVTSIRRLRSTP